MTPQELRDRTAEFARRVESLTRRLLRSIETRDAARQLADASSSMAATYRSAGRARSHKEFTAKIGAVLEGADESQFWLEHLSRCGLVTGQDTADLITEASELVAIFTRASQTAQGRENERNNPPRPPDRRHGR